MPGYAPNPADLVAWLRKLEQRVRKLESSPRAAFTSIQNGLLQVLRSDGSRSIYMGTLAPPFGEGLVHQRADGSVGLVATDAFVGIFDKSGNTVLSDDAVSGQGIAGLQLPLTFYPQKAIGGANATVNGSAGTTELWWSMAAKQQPRVWVTVNVFASGADCQVDLYDKDNGVVIAGPVTVPAGTGQLVSLGPVALSGAWQQMRFLAIRGTTTGSGTVGVSVALAVALQS